MKLGRRSFLAFLGMGSAAAPVALPAFGKAVAQQQMMQSDVIARYGTLNRIGDEPDGPSVAHGTVREVVHRKLFQTPLNMVIDEVLARRQKEAEEDMRRLHEHVDEMYNLPSWSQSFRRYTAKREEARRRELYNIASATITEKTMKWFTDNGGDVEGLRDKYRAERMNRASTSGENAARSRG